MRLRIATLIAASGITAIALCGSAVIASANPPPDKKQHQNQNHQPQKPKPAHQQQKPPQAQARKAQPPAPQPHAQQQAHAEQPRTKQHAPKQAAPQRAQAQPRAQAPQQARHETAPPRGQPSQPAHNQPARQQAKQIRGNAPQAHEVRAQPARIPAPPAHVSTPASPRVAATARGGRLAPQQQQVLISQQQRRITQYSTDLGQARRVAAQQSVELQHQHRTAQYRFMQGYLSGLQQQEVALQDYRYHDYDTDPYFYTPADYRYYRGGSYYETNEYGVALLRTAVNNGYREGWLAGTADREDGWQSSYRSCYAYRDANYGYNGYYLDRTTYNYYFREGFRRGYDDGYDRSYRYGQYSNGTRSLLGSVLNVVLRIEHVS